MNRLKFTLSVVVFAAFVTLGLGGTKARAGVVVVSCTEDQYCMGELCTVCCEDQPSGHCTGVEGTDGPDVFCGSQLADTIFAGDGDDIVCAGKGEDVVSGEEGDDNISGGEDNDYLYGNENDDILDGGPDNDVMFGGDDDDHLFGGSGPDILFGDAGDDYIEGGKGADGLHGGDDTDECHGGPQNDFFFDDCECGSVGPTNGPQGFGETHEPWEGECV